MRKADKLTTVCPYCEARYTDGSKVNCPYGHHSISGDASSTPDSTGAVFPLWIAAWLAILAVILGYRLMGGTL